MRQEYEEYMTDAILGGHKLQIALFKARALNLFLRFTKYLTQDK